MTRSSPVRWGIAGTGGIANAMATALAAIEGCEVVAVGSRRDDTAAAFAERHDLPRAHGSYPQLMEDPEVDVVYVATPHSHHLEHTTAALRAGKHVLCEKAFALDADEARAMVAVAKAQDRFLMEAMWTWFLPATERLVRLIGEGQIGEVRSIQADFGLRIDATTGRLVDPALGGGSLLDMGIYPVALTRLLLGSSPTEVAAVGRHGPTGVDTNVGVVLGHASGAVATFTTSLESNLPMQATVVGTAGRVHMGPPFNGAPWLDVVTGDERVRIDLPHRGLAHEVEHVLACLDQGRRESPVLPLATTVEMMTTLDRIRSAMVSA